MWRISIVKCEEDVTNDIWFGIFMRKTHASAFLRLSARQAIPCPTSCVLPVLANNVNCTQTNAHHI